MSEESWKVQFSKKVGQDLWNFRGQNVAEVKAMRDEALGEKELPKSAETVAVLRNEEADPAPAEEGTLTPVEKARLRMAAKKEAK